MKFFRILKLLTRRKPFVHFLRRGFWKGECPICGGSAIFYLEGDYRRDQLRCLDCYSIPRWRAVMDLLRTRYPDWKNMKIHESSASGPVYHLLLKECKGYLASQFFEGVANGEVYQGFRCEDLGNQTFPDESFDLVITQDVLEHLPDPKSAFQEIARTLKPGGAHLFTVPWYRATKTRVRTEFKENGVAEHLLPPQYPGWICGR